MSFIDKPTPTQNPMHCGDECQFEHTVSRLRGEPRLDACAEASERDGAAPPAQHLSAMPSWWCDLFGLLQVALRRSERMRPVCVPGIRAECRAVACAEAIRMSQGNAYLATHSYTRITSARVCAMRVCQRRHDAVVLATRIQSFAMRTSISDDAQVAKHCARRLVHGPATLKPPCTSSSSVTRKTWLGPLTGAASMFPDRSGPIF